MDDALKVIAADFRRLMMDRILHSGGSVELLKRANDLDENQLLLLIDNSLMDHGDAAYYAVQVLEERMAMSEENLPF